MTADLFLASSRRSVSVRESLGAVSVGRDRRAEGRGARAEQDLPPSSSSS